MFRNYLKNKESTCISIHAPAEGATRYAFSSVTCSTLFQSTLPRRERPKPLLHVLHLRDFNPRSRGGSDLKRCIDIFCFHRFQSTLPRRERPSRNVLGSSSINISIHAPAEGATHGIGYLRKTDQDFNPRSRGGSDCHLLSKAVYNRYFNPRSRGGSDIHNSSPQGGNDDFNPRARGWSDP